MFRTELTIAPQERLLPRTARVLTVGSCFADSIGERLRLNKVPALVNPFGTVFQPLALAQLLRAAAGEALDWQQHLVEARGRWQSYDFHGTIGAESPVELLQTIQETVRRVGEFVRTADTVVLTLGTAWAYRLRETGELVSNLHKLPASLFEKELLTADELVNGLAEVHALLRRANPNVHLVLTVSPVRHLKDTLPLNAVSKSVLRVACHYLSELLPGVSYFPAYELLTDDLRDYRFYAADLLHPSEVAEDYIWERFARTYFDADFGRFRKEWAAVRQALGHRPLHPGAPEHRAFLDQTRERLERLAEQGVDVRQELRDVQRRLAALPPPRPVRVPEPAPEDDEERIDIGEGATGQPATNATPATDTAPPQPGRNRRDGRRNERPERDGRRPERHGPDRRHGRPLAETEPLTAATAGPEPTPTEELPAESVAAPAETLLTGAEPELLAPEEAGGYPAKKKKRRSRGGAKRTARKNAALLATGQVEAPPEPLAEAELAEEPAQETTGFETEAPAAVAEPASPTSEAEEVDPLPTARPEPEADEVAVAPVAEAPALPRKRGTGPTPKKSKVITKSGLVKRGQRNNLYRAPTTEPAAGPEPTAVVAPIVSPPIVPELLLERPAVELAAFPSPPQAVEAVAAASELPSAAPAEAAPAPKRGRPKARTARPAVAPEPAPTPAVTETPPAATDAAAAPAKKPAARAAKAAKPAAPKKATTAPRRGRPPGKKTPPTDAPAA